MDAAVHAATVHPENTVSITAASVKTGVMADNAEQIHAAIHVVNVHRISLAIPPQDSVSAWIPASKSVNLHAMILHAEKKNRNAASHAIVKHLHQIIMRPAAENFRAAKLISMAASAPDVPKAFHVR
jgi:hypothetical protein